MEDQQEREQEVSKIVDKSLNAPGFLLLAAVLTPEKRDDRDFPTIEFSYIRHKFSYDDALQAVEALKEHIKNDMREQLDPTAEDSADRG